jgi:hypothetical protein
MCTILYVSKEQLTPNFGRYSNGLDLIEIRNDLPRCAKEFLLDHEYYHRGDKEPNWLKREIKANWCGFKWHPIGGIITLIMSFAPYRLTYYWNRFKEGR